MNFSSDSAIHIQAVRRALANGNAAVMVGAGFSRNAEGGEQLKMWDALGQELWASLNPTVQVQRKEFPPSLVTQMAEQYARVFSPPALEDLLKQHIPDDRVVPGPLHMQLLELDWCEIFTTNYDTLLERAADQLLNRAHFTVRCREDIPQSKILNRRRIVKLHGSFPSHRPFIFTEEDYRRYPEDFAPFVNLVRQSLIENVFCLIGFSGDDPNFLHWIGWVRDMLDQHALPIYLFMDREPTLGERKLLEVRRVTPVTLPYPEGNDEADYAQRLSELFRQLAQPLTLPPREWGEVRWPVRTFQSNEPDEDRFKWLLGTYPLFLELRESYPGWMVAPHSVRRRLKATIDNLPIAFEDRRILEYLDMQQPAALAVVFLAHYSWVRDTLLLPLLDSAAQFGVRVLNATAQLTLETESEATRDLLKRLGVSSQQSFDRCWRELAFGLVQWARQGMYASLLQELCDLVRAKLPDDLEAEDRLQYESILLCLYQGERQHARSLLREWEVRSSEPYMKFRKGVLLGELGNVEIADELCSEAIRLLRRLQKIRPESALLLSQEAWACFVTSHVRRGSRLYSSLVKGSPSADEQADDTLLNRRLRDLAAKGFEPLADLNAATAALNAEALPPSEPRYNVGDFDLGRVRTIQQMTWSSELTQKIEAAFAWLTLAERVGFGPRYGNVAHDLGSFTRAAWWIQFADSTRRMLSVVIRTMSKEAFNPKDPSLSSGRTGWLSRYQIARLDREFAQEICERSLRQVEAALAANVDVHRTCSFYLELFSRLILRVEAIDAVLAMADRVIALNSQVAVGGHSQLWSVFARALARCFEATPAFHHLDLVRRVIQLPLLPQAPSDNRFLHDWLQLHRVSVTIPNGQAIPPSLSTYVDRLIEELGEQHGNPQEYRARWDRLLWLDSYSVLSDEQRRRVGLILWRGNEQWPIIPGYAPFLASLWPGPGPDVMADLFRQWILRGGIAGFREPSAMLLSIKGRTWGLPANNTFLTSWQDSLRMAPWPEDAWLSGLRQIVLWWAAESQDLEKDIQRHEDLSIELMQRLELIDAILGTYELWTIAEESVEIHSLINRDIAVIVESGRSMGAPFWRFRIQRAVHADDVQSLDELERELAGALVSPRSAGALQQACAAARWWIERSFKDGKPAGLLIDTVIGILSGRRIPALTLMLDLLIRLLKGGFQVLDASRATLVNLALAALLRELDYANRPTGSAIPDEEVPTLRFLCAMLSSLIIEANGEVDKSTALQWVHSANTDPLPEMRFERYRVAVANNSAH